MKDGHSQLPAPVTMTAMCCVASPQCGYFLSATVRQNKLPSISRLDHGVCHHNRRVSNTKQNSSDALRFFVILICSVISKNFDYRSRLILLIKLNLLIYF